MKIDTIFGYFPWLTQIYKHAYPDINAVINYERSEEIRRTS